MSRFSNGTASRCAWCGRLSVSSVVARTSFPDALTYALVSGSLSGTSA
jgi:hypothetical protein